MMVSHPELPERKGKSMDQRFIAASIIVVCATLLYVVGLAVANSTPVEPQSIFTLYGAVLGYLFVAHEKEGKREEVFIEGIKHAKEIDE
jgi:hypothetical protein